MTIPRTPIMAVEQTLEQKATAHVYAQMITHTYKLMRAEGKLLDDEWNKFVEKELDSDAFVHSIILAMALGGLDVPLKEREEFFIRAPMQEWANLCLPADTNQKDREYK